MKVLPFKIPKPEHDALVYQEDIGPIFYNKLHQHEEIQISFIVEGKGTLIVGDTVNDYNKGDLLVIGSNLPHVFESDSHSSPQSQMLSLFFTKTAFGSHFFNLEELKELNSFFKRATYGFKFISEPEVIKSIFLRLKKASKLEQFMSLLKLLKLTSEGDYNSLSSFIYDKKYNAIEGKRMQNIFEYTMKHYDKDISLDTIASVASMTKNAFCKYFKKRTNKTYFRFLSELRIEYACKLMESHNDLSISEIAYKAGFKNISNFNRQFKTIKLMTPTNYKKS
ncbi:AraC family transcriptional regulator [Pontimicrobium sp. MEBiC06410]